MFKLLGSYINKKTVSEYIISTGERIKDVENPITKKVSTNLVGSVIRYSIPFVPRPLSTPGLIGTEKKIMEFCENNIPATSENIKDIDLGLRRIYYDEDGFPRDMLIRRDVCGVQITDFEGYYGTPALVYGGTVVRYILAGVPLLTTYFGLYPHEAVVMTFMTGASVAAIISLASAEEIDKGCLRLETLLRKRRIVNTITDIEVDNILKKINPPSSKN